MGTSGLQELIPESVSATTATPAVDIGTEAWFNGNRYLYVYNQSTSTAGVNYGVVYSAASGYSVTVSSVSGEKLAGVVVHTAIEPHYYGWICTKGNVDATCSTGFGVGGDATSNKVALVGGGFFTGITDGTHGWTGIVAGFSTYLSCAADGTTNMWINC